MEGLKCLMGAHSFCDVPQCSLTGAEMDTLVFACMCVCVGVCVSLGV